MDEALRRAIAEVMSSGIAGPPISPQRAPLPSSMPDIRFGIDSGEYGRPQMRGGLNVPLGGNDFGVSGSYKPDAVAPEWSAMGRLTRQF